MREAMAANPPPITEISTHELTVTSGNFKAYVYFNREVTMADATRLADMMSRWCEHFSIGGHHE